MKFTEEIEGYRGKKNTKDIRILDIDPSLHKAFQALCHDEQKSMNLKLKEMIEKETALYCKICGARKGENHEPLCENAKV